ncbi:hypothetical protein A9Q99_05960 [Gammaproteobacteria bacterium 45_16_T64]|nr:hypothetical protein A9Q99_05960 [Gammaproteobacteria bacterium 45_16_T64]
MSKVLCLDPSHVFLEILRAGLEDEVSEVICTKSPDEALSLVSEDRDIKVITVSHVLDGDNNREFIKQIRLMDKYNTLPIYLITCSDDARVSRDAFMQGATDIFRKDKIEDAINTIKLSIRRSSQTLSGRVLVLEDSPTVGMIVKKILNNLGLKVDLFTTVDTAWNAFLDNYYQCVYTDLLLEGTDTGITFIRLVRGIKDLKKQSIPILVATAFDQRSRQMEVFNLGVDEYIVKPIHDCELVPRISNLITRKQMLDELSYREKLLEKMVVYDPISGLYNRNGINENASRLFKCFRRHESIFTLMVIDLDGFKEFNDLYGHAAGDEAIAAVGQALKHILRDVDIAGRWGGDEFVVMLDNCIVEASVAVANRIFTEINHLYLGDMKISASLGLSQSVPEDCGFEDVFSRADKAMYNIKAEGKGGVLVYRECVV